MRVYDPVRSAYRATFGEYASKLETLQRLLESNRADSGCLDAAMRDVETARRAYHSARELLASELGLNRRARAAEAAAR